MASKFAALLLSLLSLCSPFWGHPEWKAPSANCTFNIPSTSDPGSCESYDLSKLASLGGVNFTSGSQYDYTLSVCAAVDPSKLPESCKGKDAAPAYQFASGQCYVIGKLDSALVVSSHAAG